jgi:putative transposase
MIEQAVSEIAPLLGTVRACDALGASRASVYRWRTPPPARPSRARTASSRALSGLERGVVLARLHETRFADCSPAHVYATLLDEGTYLASERTMYRLLAAQGEVRERRDQLTHPPYTRPELLASEPNQVWSWDIERHEALCNRAVMKGHRLWSVAADR